MIEDETFARSSFETGEFREYNAAANMAMKMAVFSFVFTFCPPVIINQLDISFYFQYYQYDSKHIVHYYFRQETEAIQRIISQVCSL